MGVEGQFEDGLRIVLSVGDEHGIAGDATRSHLPSQALEILTELRDVIGRTPRRDLLSRSRIHQGERPGHTRRVVPNMTGDEHLGVAETGLPDRGRQHRVPQR